MPRKSKYGLKLFLFLPLPTSYREKLLSNSTYNYKHSVIFGQGNCIWDIFTNYFNPYSKITTILSTKCTRRKRQTTSLLSRKHLTSLILSFFCGLCSQRSSSSHLFTIPESTNSRNFRCFGFLQGRSFLLRSKIEIKQARKGFRPISVSQIFLGSL